MIIVFGGRKGSGKTLFSSKLVEKGFHKISFADYLRTIISELYEFDIVMLKTAEGKSEILSIPLEWNNIIAQKLFEIVNIRDFNYPIENKIFHTRREAMQYIGTDILRKYDINFHISKTIMKIQSNLNYVCDDIRYPNELRALSDLGAIDYFILRPNNFDISNHISETSLTWKDFTYHIINDREFKLLEKDFTHSLHYINYTPEIRKNHIQLTREDLLNYLEENNYDTELTAMHFQCSRDKIIWWCKKYLIHISNNKFYHNKMAFMIPNKYSSYYAGLLSADGCIKASGGNKYKTKYHYIIELASNDISLIEGFRNFLETNKPFFSKTRYGGTISYTIAMSCPFLIENIKHWNLKPRKSKYNEIPDIIKNNNKLLKYWLLGLIDGDGSVFLDKRGGLNISVLASKEIIDFYTNMFSNIKGSVSNHKKIENLYQWRISNKNAISLYQEIYDPIALNRKWNKVQTYLNNQQNTKNKNNDLSPSYDQ